MSLHFSIQNVSADFIMDVAKVISSSPRPLSQKDICTSLKKSESYVKSAISQYMQLSLIDSKDARYTGSEEYGMSIKRISRKQLYVYFRDALQKYPPFLLYADFLTKGYDAQENSKHRKRHTWNWFIRKNYR